MLNDYYTVEQISNILSIHPKTVQRYIREGKMHATKIGKSWRVSGHDLSVFTEYNSNETSDTLNSAVITTSASSVIDISSINRENAMRIMNTLTATLNAKPVEYGESTMHTQYIERESIVRVTLWGNVRFMAIMLDTIVSLT